MNSSVLFIPITISISERTRAELANEDLDRHHLKILQLNRKKRMTRVNIQIRNILSHFTHFKTIAFVHVHRTGSLRKTLNVANDFFEVSVKQYGDRKRKVVLPGWSSKLFTLCYENFHLPCVWSFSRASWRKKDIICKSKCSQKGCEACIEATLPHRSINLHIKIEKYESEIPHDPKKKRRLLPNETKELAEILRGRSAFELNNEMAASMQDENFPERADLPSLNAYRVIKYRSQYPEEKDAFKALDSLKEIHVNCIHKIGYDPFYVIYELLRKSHTMPKKDKEEGQLFQSTQLGLDLLRQHRIRNTYSCIF